ncbi:hypothetical protein DDE18_19720 [Nocardioides gansuensis]|uniref:Uncharacterized protein n=1 Tax=Nocardioides gansuensis TaxID=2138300 RepID=A0A2T8F5R1_9ACTN|nr:hypothetical protein [Nocardioides gansuensis]PVG81051.1 hypothetical protein DDE18_19720 [Nocardioides gansuensis]
MQEQTTDGATHGKRRISRKKRVVALTVLLVGIAGAAFAYWTATGTGSGSADTGTTAGITVHQTSTVTNLAPGSGTQPLSGKFTNTNDGPVYVTAVAAEVTEVNDALGDPVDGCSAADYTIAGTGVVGAEVPVGANVGSWGNLTIAFNNTAANQDACKNAQLVISYTAS